MSLGLLWNEIQNNALLTRLFQTYYEIKWYKWKVIIFVKMLFTPRDSVLLWQWSTNGIVVYIFPQAGCEFTNCLGTPIWDPNAWPAETYDAVLFHGRDMDSNVEVRLRNSMLKNCNNL